LAQQHWRGDAIGGLAIFKEQREDVKFHPLLPGKLPLFSLPRDQMLMLVASSNFDSLNAILSACRHEAAAKIQKSRAPSRLLFNSTSHT